jgi:hypothetical protein
VDYIGAYAYWDLPTQDINVSRNLEEVEDTVVKNEELPVIDRQNDPPVTSV